MTTFLIHLPSGLARRRRAADAVNNVPASRCIRVGCTIVVHSDHWLETLGLSRSIDAELRPLLDWSRFSTPFTDYRGSMRTEIPPEKVGKV